MALFTIYSSSAGSGKTFTLTRQYLRLALGSEHPTYYRKILAMTFTNEAAEQMKRRIVGALKDLKSGQDGSSPLLGYLLDDLRHISEEELRRRAGEVLHDVLQNYQDFAIKTIDSFVNQVISSFTFDLRLPYNYEIILETEELITEAVKNLVDRVGDDPELTEMFKEFALSKLEENQSWNTLENDIVQFAKVIYQANNATEIAKNIGLRHRDVLEVKTKIRRYIKDTEKQIADLAGKAVTLISSQGLSESDFFGGKRGIWNFYHKLHRAPAELWGGTATARKTMTDDRWYKDKSATAARVEEILPRLREITGQILDLETEQYPILKAVNKNLLKIPFLAAVKAEIDQILEETDGAVLADFNQKILDIVTREPIPYIYERIGEKYNHILVDEFQDTSDMQFFNLLPLFENTVSKNFENLIVGDPKQAIYSWRGGNVMLMLDLVNRQKNYLEAKTPELQLQRVDTLQSVTKTVNLTTNYRSRKGVIDFNNALFAHIREKQDSEAARQVFSDFFQETPTPPKAGGYTAVEVLRQGEDDPALKIIARVEEILADGYRLSDICILCRQGKEGIQMAEILKSAGYEINSSEALKVKNNREVRFLVAALRFALYPERQFERFEFLQFFFLVKNIDSSLYDLQAVCAFPPSGFLAFFTHFGIDLDGMTGLDPYQLSEFFTAKFGLMETEKPAEYVLAFLDHVLNFTLRRSKSLSDFLRDWEVRKDKLAVPARAGNAITIHTIHKAKGLEYPVVILPFIHWSTSQKGSEPIWLSLDELPYPELEAAGGRIRSAPFNYSHDFEFAAPVIQRERDLYLIENLNLLYVALTRAIDRQYLWIWGKENKSGFSIENIGQLLGGYLQAEGQPLLPLYEFGEKTAPVHEEKDAGLPVHTLPPRKAFEGKNSLQIKWGPSDASIREGNLIHRVFESIESASDLEPVLDALESDGLIPAATRPALEQKIRSVLEHPDLAPLFQAGARVKNEAEILSSHSHTRRPDRVVFLEEGVYILDYKTGKRRTAHEKQLQDYARLLRQMGYTEVHLFLVYLDPPQVVPVPSPS